MSCDPVHFAPEGFGSYGISSCALRPSVGVFTATWRFRRSTLLSLPREGVLKFIIGGHERDSAILRGHGEIRRVLYTNRDAPDSRSDALFCAKYMSPSRTADSQSSTYRAPAFQRSWKRSWVGVNSKIGGSTKSTACGDPSTVHGVSTLSKLGGG